MMLMKLLHTTNTLSEAKDQPHRYKVRAGGLPTFGNPTEPAVKNFSGASAERAKAAPVQRPVKTTPGAGWAKKLNPFAKQGAPVERTAVQGELSLDKVRPLRNDLNDLAGTELAKPVRTAEATPEKVRNVVRIGAVEVPVVKVAPVWARVRGFIERLRP
jgi:hypothetical protein